MGDFVSRLISCHRGMKNWQELLNVGKRARENRPSWGIERSMLISERDECWGMLSAVSLGFQS